VKVLEDEDGVQVAVGLGDSFKRRLGVAGVGRGALTVGDGKEAARSQESSRRRDRSQSDFRLARIRSSS